MNTQRRIFRGRAGPTDRRLPKHNARRRKQPLTANNRDDAGVSVNVGVGEQQTVEELNEENAEIIPVVEEESSSEEVESPASDHEDATPAPEEEQLEPSPCDKEIEHVRRRVKNVREAFQTANAITNPTTYEQNVLNAAANCVNEWRSITNCYSDMDPDQKKKTALAIFGLIQHSLQCGPLAGANPGYFKRCGGQVAKVVAKYLEAIMPHHLELGQRLGFSEKQMDAMVRWQSNAKQAAESDKPPSKSQLKKQQGKDKTKKTKMK